MKNLIKFRALRYLMAMFPLLLLVSFGHKPFQMSFETNGLYLLCLGVYLCLEIYRKIKKTPAIKNFVHESICILIIGLVYFYNDQTAHFHLMQLFFIFSSLYIMFEANTMALVPQDAPNAGIMQAYNEKGYKQSQRMAGRFRFGIGLMGFIAFLVAPKAYFGYTMVIWGTILFAGTIVWLYKSSKAAE